jgi:hypothetical protein
MEQTASQRYARLSSSRTTYLRTARECARLSVPYLMPPAGHYSGSKLPTPWQSIGAKGVNVMASKLMLSLFPVNTTFFKLQINDGKLSMDPNIDKKARSEIDLTLSKIERIVMQSISESQDRVILHQAMKHLVVSGNVLLMMGKKHIKLYPLERYVVNRDGDGQPTEIVTVEAIDRQFLPEEFQKSSGTLGLKADNHPGDDSAGSAIPDLKIDLNTNDVAVYTWAKLKDGQWYWHQEAEGQIIPGTESKAPKTATAWLPLRFNIVDGEDYGRGRIEEYLGDLKSLEALMQALVEGSAAAAKVVFTVSPSATTKPSALAEAGNGAIIQGRPDDIGVVQVGKTADFKTAFEMVNTLTQRLSEAFLVFTARSSERTTAEEIRSTQQELNEQLGGIYGNLTTELLTPYLARKLMVLQRSKELPPLPKGIVFPTVIAGLEGIGRGQDRESLMLFIQTLAQGMGPQIIQSYINPDEAIKRLAASFGIESLGLVKSPEDRQAEADQAQQDNMNQSLMSQAGQLAKAPLADPSRNPALQEQLANNGNQQQPPVPAQAGPDGGGAIQGQ